MKKKVLLKNTAVLLSKQDSIYIFYIAILYMLTKKKVFFYNKNNKILKN